MAEADPRNKSPISVRRRQMVRRLLQDFARGFRSHSNGLIQFQIELSPAVPAVAPTENQEGQEVHAFRVL